MATMAQLQYSPLAGNFGRLNPSRHSCNLQSPNFPEKNLASFPSLTFSGSPLQSKPLNPSLLPSVQIAPCAGGGDNIGGIAGSGGRSGGGGGGGGAGGGGSSGSSPSLSSLDSLGLIGILLSGWRSRVAADPQFLFKVLMEEVVGVSACVLGDMASRPNFGLNELDFVFSTLVVGSILNFTLMYLLAPTMSSSASALPFVFAKCPTSHMFEPGAYSLLNRFGTFTYKGTVFAAVGFAAGLVGTTLSNGLIKMRKKMDPSFEPPNKPPPTVLNALTWALHMGLSSNLRYQTLNGVEFLLAKGLPPFAFKTSVILLRCLNNVLGGVSFVLLARLTGSQSAAQEKKTVTVAAEGDSDTAPEKVKLLNEVDETPVSK